MRVVFIIIMLFSGAVLAKRYQYQIVEPIPLVIPQLRNAPIGTSNPNNNPVQTFCKGFKKGYSAGYKERNRTGFAPSVMCPIQPIKGYTDPKSDFEHGFVVGFKRGQR